MPAPEIVDALVTNGDAIRWARLAKPGPTSSRIEPHHRVLEEAGFDSEAVVAAAHIEEHGLHLPATATGRYMKWPTGRWGAYRTKCATRAPAKPATRMAAVTTVTKSMGRRPALAGGVAGRRLRPEQLDGEAALEEAKAFARAERD